MKVKVLVAAHKEFPMPTDTVYLPILVGAVNNYKSGILYQRDDQGLNISEKNPNFNELTAIYWAWKNLDADAIGLVHYRRFLSLHRSRDMGGILNENDLNQLLSKYDVILPKRRKYYIESNYNHYIHAHENEPLNITKEIISEKFPQYSSSFDVVMKKSSAHMFNMFIMKRNQFDQYCNWLFTILFELENRINIDEFSTQEKRVFGYISELLLDVWLSEQSNIRIKEVNWIQIGNRHVLKKAFYFLKRKFVKSSTNQTHF